MVFPFRPHRLLYTFLPPAVCPRDGADLERDVLPDAAGKTLGGTKWNGAGVRASCRRREKIGNKEKQKTHVIIGVPRGF